MTIHRLDDKKKRCLAQLFLIRLSLYLFLFLGCFPRSVYGECCLLQVNGQICNDTALVFIYLITLLQTKSLAFRKTIII